MRFDQVLGALQVALALRELRLVLHEQRLGRMQLRLRLRQRGALRGVIQAPEDLPLLDVIALLDQHLGEGAGDLRRHGRLAARGDVTGGIEHRGARGRPAGTARAAPPRARAAPWRDRG